MSCCCCWRRKDAAAGAEADANEKIEIARAAEGGDDDGHEECAAVSAISIGSRGGTLRRQLTIHRRPARDVSATRPNDDQCVLLDSKSAAYTRNGTELDYIVPAADDDGDGYADQADDAEGEVEAADDCSSEVGSLHASAACLGAAKAGQCDSANDSYEEFRDEFAVQKQQNSQNGDSLYVLYTGHNGNSCPAASSAQVGNADLMMLGLRRQRTDFLDRRAVIADNILGLINTVRQKNGCEPLEFSQDLNAHAERLWHGRAGIRDGFVAIPRCVYFPITARRNSANRFGCLSYYTPRAAHLEYLPEALVHFWSNGGRPRNFASAATAHRPTISFRNNSPSDFPSARTGETYVDKDSKMGRAFERYRGDSRAQLLAKECKLAGIHMDMAQISADIGLNIVCVVAVFDFVANEKGRTMKDPRPSVLAAPGCRVGK